MHQINEEPITNMGALSIYAFEVVACYLLHDKTSLLQSLQLASKYCPVLLHAKLYPFTGKSNLEESMQCIQEEAEQLDSIK